MKIHLSIIKKFLNWPFSDLNTAVYAFDELGLEVKNYTELPNQDVILTIETLANRADHQSALGMARELSAKFLTPLKWPSLSGQLDSNRPTSVPIRIVTEDCFAYHLLEIIVSNDFRLRPEIAATLLSEPKHPLIETANFLQKELGHPLHIFDRDKVRGEIVIDNTSNDQEIVALDGKSYNLPKKSLVIRDQEKILAVAGVIGCLSSAVSETTKRILVESALFDPIVVRKNARSLGLATDAAKIFERGASYSLIPLALRRLAFLLDCASLGVDLGGSQIVGYSKLETKPFSPKDIILHLDTIRSEINSPRLDGVEVEKRLENLGFVVEKIERGKSFKVSVPDWRQWDVEDEADLVEEFIRVFGLDRIKTKPLTVEVVAESLLKDVNKRRVVSEQLTNKGFFEVITPSFYSENMVKISDSFSLGSSAEHIRLLNSLEQDNSALRTNLMLHLLNFVTQNKNWGEEIIKGFEIAKTYRKNELGVTQEIEKLGVVFFGPFYEGQNSSNITSQQNGLLFKGVIEDLLNRFSHNCKFSEGACEYFHPAKQAVIASNSKKLGEIGAINPKLLSEFKITSEVYYAELDYIAFCGGTDNSYTYIEPFRQPTITRDFTVFLPTHIKAGLVRDRILKIKPDYLLKVEIADWFQPKNEAELKVTYRATFGDPNKSLTNEDIQPAWQAILDNIVTKQKLRM
jgi:phenylalanyl-tRNA synthetase beta chain